MNPFVWFVDTGFWIALVNRDDEFHARARVLNATLRGSFVTTEAILLEIGDPSPGSVAHTWSRAT
ncbi:MAG: hypothetical protein AB7U18_24460, partial [Dehalococcoidia bacterium]